MKKQHHEGEGEEGEEEKTDNPPPEEEENNQALKGEKTEKPPPEEEENNQALKGEGEEGEEEKTEKPPPKEEENNQALKEDRKEPVEIKLETAPFDYRFPGTNQTRHCYTRYLEYHKCIAAKGEGAPECEKFAKYYRSLCPSEWIERWNEQRAKGIFPGPL